MHLVALGHGNLSKLGLSVKRSEFAAFLADTESFRFEMVNMVEEILDYDRLSQSKLHKPRTRLLPEGEQGASMTPAHRRLD